MKTILFTCLLLSTICLSQKKEYYFNSIRTNITKAQYEVAGNTTDYLKFSFENDTAKIFLIEKRDVEGTLTEEMKKAVSNLIQDKTKDTLFRNKPIVINYHYGEDRCNSTSDKYYVKGKYDEFVKKSSKAFSDLQIMNFYSNSEGIFTKHKSRIWHKDEDDVLRNAFFSMKMPCGSFVVIFPDDTYYVWKGEYSFDQIYDVLEKKLKPNP